ncbi:MAG: hydroxyacylglutathione hydrolase [Candidatus Lightella neohaematopini]|nr:hydroxyacylglutathione hydrolase [Candidatus Lightella neohaematopini]
MLKVTVIRTLVDNYIWLILNDDKCLIIDPNNEPLITKFLKFYKLRLMAILITHNHDDHTSGVHILKNIYQVPVYGPKETDYLNSYTVENNNIINILQQYKFTVLSLPGHTKYHVGYYHYPWLFCGDTLFSAGCGKIFDSSIENMFNSLNKINKLPSNTIIFPSHEYTIKNLDFIITNNITLLDNMFIIKYYKRIVKRMILNKIPSLPTSLYLERIINPFIQCTNSFYYKNKFIKLPKNMSNFNYFKFLRNKKDIF